VNGASVNCVDKAPLWKRGDRGDLKGTMLRYNRNLKECSRSLRENMTEAERLLWKKVRGKQLKGYQFYRQKTIGNSIVDFYCPKAKLVIELDGGQHYSFEGKEKDRERDGYMKSIGLRVLRFSDKEVFENIQGVFERIWGYL
jgi:very-short-patch-repair endonuclease